MKNMSRKASKLQSLEAAKQLVCSVERFLVLRTSSDDFLGTFFGLYYQKGFVFCVSSALDSRLGSV